MAEATINIDVRNQRVAEAIRYLEQMDKAERKLAANAVGLGKATRKTARSGNADFASMARSALGVVTALTGVAGVTSIIQMGIARAKADFEELKQLQAGAALSQQSMADAVGVLISNNPQLSETDIQRWMDFAQKEGTILGERGPQRVLQAVTATRSGTPGATEEQQMEAVQRAILQARIAPDTDMGQFATAVVKIMQELGTGSREATNLLLAMGARAGGDIATLAGQVGKLRAAVGPSGGSLQDVLSMFAFLTGELGDVSGEATTTSVLNVMTKMRTRDIKMPGGRMLEKRGDDATEMLLNAIEDIEAGLYGETAEEIETAMDFLARQIMRGAAGTAAAGAFRGDARARFEETRIMLRDAGDEGTDFQERQMETKRRVAPQIEGIEGVAERKGQLENILQGTRAAAHELARQNVATEMKALGVTRAWDIGVGLRERAALASGMRGEEFQEAEMDRQTWRAIEKEVPLAMRGVPYTRTGQEPDAEGISNAARMRQEGASREDILRELLMQGAVRPEGGVSGLEHRMLQAGGAEEAEIQALKRLDQNLETQEQFVAAMNELVTRLQEAIREGVREGAREGTREGAEEGTREGAREGTEEGARDGVRDATSEHVPLDAGKNVDAS